MENYIKNYLTEHRGDIVEMLKDIASIPSVKGVPTEAAPFGEGCKRVLERTKEIYGSEGFEVAYGEDFKYLKVTTDGDEKLIGIFTHADVVPANENDWIYTKPFDIIEKDGFLIGRGVHDNKSGVVSALWAMKALREADALPKSRVLIFAGADEESGMSDITAFAENEEMPSFSIIPDNDYPVCRGEKTIASFWASFNSSFDDIKEIKGGSAFNIVLGSVDIKLQDSDKLFEELIHNVKDDPDASVSRADGVITLTAKGISTHAAYPKKSKNALMVAIDILEKCSISYKDKTLLKNIRPLLSDPFMRDVGLYTTDSDFGDTTCVNGIAETSDGKLRLSFDCRFGMEIDSAALLEGFKKYLSKIGAELEIKYNLAGYVIPESDPLVAGIMEVFQKSTGDTEKKPYLSRGGTYSRFLKNAVSTGLYIPKTTPLDLPYGHGDAHQPDELIDIDGLIDGIGILAHMIIKTDEILHIDRKV